MKIESSFEEIFKRVPLGLALIDSKADRLVAANKSFRDMFGPDSSAEASSPYMAPTHPNDLQKALAKKEKMCAGDLQDFTVEKCHVRKDGSSFWFNLTVSPLSDCAEEPVYMLVIVEEITARKEAEEQLKETNRLLDQRVEERTGALQAKAQELEAAIKLQKEHEAELRERNQELQEANTALKVLLQKQEEIRTEIGEDLLGTIKIAVEPSLKKLAQVCTDEKQQEIITVIEAHLKEVIKPLPRQLASKNLDLSRTELTVADLIKNGLTNKQVAQNLNISVDTVAFHRKNIRRKLGLNNKGTSLAQFLQNLG